jgi:hypothetical protein
MEMTERQRLRLRVLRHYQEYVVALHAAHLDSLDPGVHDSRRRLARAIEEACLQDPWLLEDFKRAFTARPSPD